MLPYAEIGLMLLKIVMAAFDRAKANQQWNAGHDAAALAASIELMKRSEQGKLISERINAMSDAELDDHLTDPSRFDPPGKG